MSGVQGVCVWGGRLGRGDLSGFSREWGLGGVRGRAGENLPLLTYVRVQRSFNVAYLLRRPFRSVPFVASVGGGGLPWAFQIRSELLHVSLGIYRLAFSIRCVSSIYALQHASRCFEQGAVWRLQLSVGLAARPDITAFSNWITTRTVFWPRREHLS